MALDIEKTFQQIQAATRNVSISKEDTIKRLASLLEMASRPGIAHAVDEKAEASRGVYAFLPASPRDEMNVRHAAPPVPEDFSVAATDGSHIATDRHLPLRCYLINLGGCLLTYGSQPNARLFTEPHLYARDEEMYITGPDSGMDGVLVDGAVLGTKRAVQELEALAKLSQEAPRDTPLLALIDGSLILWGLSGQQYPSFLVDTLIGKGLVSVLDSLREQSRHRPMVPAAYISLPGTTEVINALRLAFCPYDVADCHQRCGSTRPGQRPCDTVHGFQDRHLFEALLAPGERSGLFATRSSVVRDHYGPHQICFCYVNNGEEIARLEMPEWVAQNGTPVDLAHAMVQDQCAKGQGYPVALSEAHEQAVVTVSDREQFQAMVEESLWGERLPTYTSEKNRSKRMRWL